MNYKKPNFSWEWNEATRYPFFKKMGKKGWIEYATKNFQILPYKSIKKQLGNVDLDYENLHSEKKERFENAFAKGVIEIPIAVQIDNDYYDLVAGNTRLAGLIKNGINPKIWVIDARDFIDQDVDDMIEEDLRKWFGKGGEGSTTGGGWDRYDSKGKKVGKCGDSKEGSAYAACLSKEKAAKLGPEGRSAFVKRKRAAQAKAGDAKKGGEKTKGQKPTFVKTGASEGLKEKNQDMQIDEKLNLFLEKNCPTDPAKWSASKSAAKKKFDVYPSAYANGWAAKNYKSKGGGWKTCNEGEQNGLCEECWDGYKAVGGKMKNGKMVPNCVPVKEEETNEASSAAQQAAIAINMKKKGIKPKNESEVTETDSSSSGAFAPALDNPIKRPTAGMANVKKYNKEGEVSEALDASASGSFDVPLFGTSPKGRKNPLSIGGTDTIYKGRAVKDKKFPKWGGPGGVFVKIKDKCKKFPYCNQGDINAVEILHEAIQEVAKNRGFSSDQIEKLVLNEIKKIFI